MTDLVDQAEAHARSGDPETSHEAAEGVSHKIRRLQAEVLAYALRCGPAGFTDVDLNVHFQTTSSTYRTRRSELRDKGLIADSGRRVGTTGRRHIVWVAVQPAAAAA